MNINVKKKVDYLIADVTSRIKKIGFAWSEKGVEKMTRLFLLQLGSTKDHWENHWLAKIGVNADTKLSFLGVKVKS